MIAPFPPNRCGIFHRGFGPEIILEGEIDLIVELSIPPAGAVGKIGQIDRAPCRREFEQRFTTTSYGREDLLSWSAVHRLERSFRVASCLGPPFAAVPDSAKQSMHCTPGSGAIIRFAFGNQKASGL